MRIAVGTLRAAKIEAVTRALERLAHDGWGDATDAELIPVAVPSGVSDMPMSEIEGITGARNRARAALSAVGAHLGMGLEGGVAVVDGDGDLVLLRNWAVATDGDREWIGSGPGVQLPRQLARAVLAGEELATAVDRYANAADVRSGRGAFGVITDDRITRADAFTSAIIAALAPWYRGGF